MSRITKYTVKYNGQSQKESIDSFGGSMASRFAATAIHARDLRQRTNAFLSLLAVQSINYIHYYNYAAEADRIVRRLGGGTVVVATIKAYKDKWKARGVVDLTLIALTKALFGIVIT